MGGYRSIGKQAGFATFSVKGQFHEPTNHADERDKTADLLTLKQYLVGVKDLFSRQSNIFCLYIVLSPPTSD